eukprot:CAMPEP_0117419498 /NCGR_PEP_ID=MMETSP0758-20121206/1041_1 /TAXON_ID=63605 /ORGANISM="Percolomonas cosmopolitus, Strain AE-1 (ATCC 50343)" /LENGTH=997 /DNA_ID=CAMNT_0005200585 /DNA_START=1517 /DNA_END=4506 /DNA_ORIENTATION=-
MRSHVRARLWPRNNMHILEQQITYENTYGDYFMFPDLFLAQSIMAKIGAEHFLSIMLHRFSRKESPLFVLQTAVDEKNDIIEHHFLHIVLMLYLDRSLSHVNIKDFVREYVLHYLFEEDNRFSKLSTMHKGIYKKINLETILEDVSTHKDGIFKVKPELWNEFSPYHSYYSFINAEKALNHYAQSHELMNLGLLPFSPILPQLENLRTIIHHEILHQCLFAIIWRTKKMIQSQEKERPRAFVTALHMLIYMVESTDDKMIQELLLSEMSDDIELTSAEELTVDSPIPFHSKLSILSNIVQPFVYEGETFSMLSMIMEIRELDYKIEKNTFMRLLKGLKSRSEKANEIIKEFLILKKSSKKKTKKSRKKKIQRQHDALNKKFDEAIEQFNVEEEEEVEKDERLCILCHSSSDADKTICLLTNLSVSSSLHFIENFNEHKMKPELYDKSDKVLSKLTPTDRHKDPCLHLDKHYELFHNINYNPGLQFHSCHHFCHAECYDAYLLSIENSRFSRGGHATWPERGEVFCPICSRLNNFTIPSIDLPELYQYENKETTMKDDQGNSNNGSTMEFIIADINEATKKTKSISNVIQAQKSTFTPFQSISDLLDRVKNIVKASLEPTTYFEFANGLAYSIATEEENQRLEGLQLLEFNESQKEMQRIILTNAIVHLNGQKLDSKFNIKKDRKLLFKCIAGETIYPFLSTDIFSMFVRILLANPDAFQWDLYKTLLICFIKAHLLQVAYVIKNEYDCPELVPLPSTIKSTKRYDIKDKNTLEIAAELCLPFLRRISLFSSIYYPSLNIGCQEVDPVKCVNLHLSNLTINIDFEKLIHQIPKFDMTSIWLNQYFNAKPTLQMVPHLTIRHPFDMIQLPYDFQDLIVPYFSKTCSILICLLSGKEIHFNCKCPTRVSEPISSNAIKMNMFPSTMFCLSLSNCDYYIINHLRLCFHNGPYVDKFGETDIGLHRGVPLYLKKENLDALRSLFILNNIEYQSQLMNDPEQA